MEGPQLDAAEIPSAMAAEAQPSPESSRSDHHVQEHSVMVADTDFDSSAMAAASSDDEEDPITEAQYQRFPKQYRRPEKIWKPFLESFTFFPSLPLEIRQTIWIFTLAPRVVDLLFSNAHGFYCRNLTPAALRVCRESRECADHYYPVCFGNIIHEPMIRFNFSIDTLYFDGCFGTEVVQFLAGLKEHEYTKIRYIAVDPLIRERREYYDTTDTDNIAVFRKATKAMSSLREFHFVFKLDAWWHGHGIPEGEGSIQLYPEFPLELWYFLGQESIHDDDERVRDEKAISECQELPNADHLLQEFDVPNVGSLWGWRPVDLDASNWEAFRA